MLNGDILSNTTSELTKDISIGGISEKVDRQERLTFDEGVFLFEHCDLDTVSGLANQVRERLHGDTTFYNRNVHINATNVCEATCIFCSFSRLKSGDPNAYTMSLDQAVGRIKALKDEFVSEVHIVNGLNPDLPFEYYTDLLKGIKKERPEIHIKAFTAVEIHYFSEKFSMSYEEVLSQLMAVGLNSLPGGGAEIFHPRARKKLCGDKVDGPGWLDIHRRAHGLGLRSTCTMLFGSIERIEERVDHLCQLRDLQDETGGFNAFVPLKYHHENNRLERLGETTDEDCLKTIAVARLMLDNIANIKAYWPMLGIDVSQRSLGGGANDMDGTVREERIYHMAGAKTPQVLAREHLIELIEEVGRVPVERDTHYNTIPEA